MLFSLLDQFTNLLPSSIDQLHIILISLNEFKLTTLSALSEVVYIIFFNACIDFIRLFDFKARTNTCSTNQVYLLVSEKFSCFSLQVFTEFKILVQTKGITVKQALIFYQFRLILSTHTYIYRQKKVKHLLFYQITKEEFDIEARKLIPESSGKWIPFPPKQRFNLNLFCIYLYTYIDITIYQILKLTNKHNTFHSVKAFAIFRISVSLEMKVSMNIFE